MQVVVRVHPGARRNHVGGAFMASDPRPGAADRLAGTASALQVWVTAPAADGRATRAVIEAVASALGVRRHEVSLLSGATSRTKRLQVPDTCAERVQALLRS